MTRYTDVYKMLAEYCQKELGLYKESGYDLKFAKVETLSDKKEEYNKHLEERRKNLTETEEWIKNIWSNYTSNGGKGYRFSQPLFYTVVFVRDGQFAGNQNGPSVWQVDGKALSMKQFFRQVKDLVYKTVNKEFQSASKRLDRMEVVVVSNQRATPSRLLLSSTGASSNVTQFAIGWLSNQYATANKEQKYQIYYPFCNSTSCRSYEDKYLIKRWDTWFLFEDKDTGDFKN